MADRYFNTLFKRDKNNNNRVYETTLYPDIPTSNSDIFIESQLGDRLDLLAYRFYGDPKLWWVLMKANAGTVRKDTLNIEGGLQIRVPQDISKIFNDLREINEKG